MKPLFPRLQRVLALYLSLAMLLGAEPAVNAFMRVGTLALDLAANTMGRAYAAGNQDPTNTMRWVHSKPAIWVNYADPRPKGDNADKGSQPGYYPAVSINNVSLMPTVQVPLLNAATPAGALGLSLSLSYAPPAVSKSDGSTSLSATPSPFGHCWSDGLLASIERTTSPGELGVSETRLQVAGANLPSLSFKWDNNSWQPDPLTKASADNNGISYWQSGARMPMAGISTVLWRAPNDVSEYWCPARATNSILNWSTTNFVNKAGDTMLGDLYFTNNRRIVAQTISGTVAHSSFATVAGVVGGYNPVATNLVEAYAINGYSGTAIVKLYPHATGVNSSNAYIDASGVQVRNVGTPTAANDAATKGYIDTKQFGAGNLADNAVTAAKLAAGAVTADKLANGAVTAAKLGQMGASGGQVLKWSGSAWAPSADLVGGGMDPKAVAVDKTSTMQPECSINFSLPQVSQFMFDPDFGHIIVSNPFITANAIIMCTPTTPHSEGFYELWVEAHEDAFDLFL
jgi:hypothetical protein